MTAPKWTLVLLAFLAPLHAQSPTAHQRRAPVHAASSSHSLTIGGQGLLLTSWTTSSVTTTQGSAAVTASPQPAQPSWDTVTPEERAQWERTAICETGGNWAMQGPVYSGIGFLNSTWLAFGGGQFAPRAGLATEDQQIMIAEKVEGGSGYVPDQNSCSSW